MTAPAAKPSCLQLFLAFTRVGVFGFGGAAALARQVVVEERGWLSERDYAEMLAAGQVLPGPNVGNTSVMIGRRFHGLPGALAASGGFYAVPLLLLTGLLLLHDRFADDPSVQSFMRGIAAAAAGMVIGTAIRMGQKLQPPPEMIAIGLMATAAAAWLRLPLPLIVLLLAPPAVWAAFRRRDAQR